MMNTNTSNPQSPTIENVDAQGIANFLNQLNAVQSLLSRAGTPLNQKQEAWNLYYLHPSENPGIAICTEIFDGTNYGSWSRAMLISLKSKNKVRFVDGSLPMPDKSDPMNEQWERCNTYVVAWINLSLDRSISKSVIWNNVAYDIWQDLKHRYYQGDRFRIAELQEELFAVRQGDMKVTSYFTRLRSIWEELENFRAIPPCECGVVCKCGLAEIRRQRDEDKITHFLRGLNEQYGPVRSQVMLMDPLPTLNTIFSLLTQQERQFHTPEPVSDQRLIAQSAILLNIGENSQSRGRGRGRGGRNNGGRGNSGGRGKLVCAHCGKNGHMIDTCYKKHGYPPHLKQKFNSGGGSAAINFNAAENAEDEDENLSDFCNVEKKSGTSLDFTPEQKMALLALLSKGEPKQTHNASQITTQPLPTPHPGYEYGQSDWSS